LVKGLYSRRNYLNVYVGLTPQQAQNLKDLAEKEQKSESAILRQALDLYLEDIENKGLPFEPYRKTPPLGLKILPRTIAREQGRRLRKLAEKSGRKISGLAREAVERFVSKKILDRRERVLYLP